MKLIVGLGNPGPQYARTRHNAGFMVVDHMVARHDLTGGTSKFHGMLFKGTIGGERCLLLKPGTFMNRSGLAVGAAVSYHRMDPVQDLMIVVDDMALPFDRIRVRASGSPGSHNGLVDVERTLGTSQYARLRVGIDPPGPVPQADYVLGRFTAAQFDALSAVLNTACDALDCWIEMGADQAMNRYNAG